MTLEIQDRVAYSPISTRPSFSWPEGKKLAVWIAVNTEHYEFMPENAGAWPRLGSSPDVRNFAQREYGNRVGIWRVFDVLDRYGITATASLNLRVLEYFPAIREALVKRNWAIMSHGLVNTANIYGMSEDDERAFFAESVRLVKEHTGRDLRGMLTPGLSANDHTPELMVEAGLTYHADWVHDDQPVPIKAENGPLISVPYTFDLNTGVALSGRFSPTLYEKAAKAQFNQLLADSEKAPRVLCISVHPFLIGQPSAIGHFESILEYIKGFPEVWWTTGDDLAEYYLANCYDAQVASTSKTMAEIGGTR
jgi:allantoinase